MGYPRCGTEVVLGCREPAFQEKESAVAKFLIRARYAQWGMQGP